MSKAIRGVYRNGVIQLLENAEVAEGTEATITFTNVSAFIRKVAVTALTDSSW